MKNKPTVVQAAQAVLDRCDGAIAQDGVGFNGMDSRFVRDVLSRDYLTYKQESAIYKLLRKYIKQLSNYGIDYNQIIPPVEKVKKVEKDGLIELRYYDHKLVLKSPFSFKEQAKAIPTARWNKEDKTWRYLARPEVYLALEPYISSGRVIPSAEAKKALNLARTASQQASKVSALKLDSSSKVPLPIKSTPYDHQATAFHIGIAADQTALLMEQGTGKTLSAIAAAGYRHSQGEVNRLLIICPLSVASVWEEEFEKHADFEYSLVNLAIVKTKKKDKELEKLGSGLQVLVINYESSWRYLDQLIKWNPDMIIADESQKIKNGRAKQSKGLFKLGDSAKYKMILTGTPITQGPLDTWSQYRFLNPDIFGRNFIAFRKRYAIMEPLKNKPQVQLVVGYRNLDELAQKAHSIAYRVTKAEALDLPPTVDQTIMVQLSTEAHKIYKQMEKDFMVTFSDEKISTAPIILTQLLRLQQITGGFLHTEDKTVEKFDSSKLAAVKELLSDLPSDKKVVIFARFSPEIEALESVSRSLGKRTLTLQGGTKDRGGVIKAFQEDPEVKVIIIQIQTGGLGITLTAADTAIFYSTTFSFADYEQAKARLHRIGQHHPVNYIHMVAEDTIDEDILAILKGKGDMATQIIDTMREKRFSKIAQKTMDKSSKVVYDKNMDTKSGKKIIRKEESYQKKEAHNVTKKEELLNMIGLDQKPKGGWYYSETTKSILRKESDGDTYILQKGVETLEEAQAIVDKINKKKEGDTNIMAKKNKKNMKSKKAVEVIEEVAEEIEDEIEDEEEEEVEDQDTEEEEEDEEEEEEAPAPKKSKKSKKAKAEAPVKETKKSKKAAKAEKAEKPAAAPIDPNAVGVKELAGMVNMDPKALRKALRDMFPDHEAKTQWVWKRDSKALNSLVKKLTK